MSEPNTSGPESFPRPLARRVSINGVEYELDVESIAREAQIQIDEGDYADEREFDAWLRQQHQQIEGSVDAASPAQDDGSDPDEPLKKRKRGL